MQITALSLLFIAISFCKDSNKRSSKNIYADHPSPTIYINYAKPLGELIREQNIQTRYLSVIIQKKKHLLLLTYENHIVKSYPVVFGSNPIDDKKMEGDGCTPEGIFHIKSKYPHAKWNKFLWLDYPTKDSYEKFYRNKKNGHFPQNASIGGQIGIHGVKSGMDKLIDNKINWTKGCISLKRADINELFDYLPDNAKVVIEK